MQCLGQSKNFSLANFLAKLKSENRVELTNFRSSWLSGMKSLMALVPPPSSRQVKTKMWNPSNGGTFAALKSNLPSHIILDSDFIKRAGPTAAKLGQSELLVEIISDALSVCKFFFFFVLDNSKTIFTN